MSTKNPKEVVKKPKKKKKSDTEQGFAFKFKMDPTRAQSAKFRQWGGSCRFLYNYFLAQKVAAYESPEKINISWQNQAKELPTLKKTQGFEWLSSTPSQCLQQSIMDLDRAYQNFFNPKLDAEFPTHHKKGKGDSFRFPDPTQFRVNVLNKNNAEVILPKIGSVCFKLSRKIPKNARIRSATVSGNGPGNEWHISFNLGIQLEDFNKQIPKNSGVPVGVDRGVVNAVAMSNGQIFNPQIDKIKDLEKKASAGQRQMKRMKKFSNNWKKANKKNAKIHTKIANMRKDWINKTTTIIAKNHGLVVLEKLRTKNMTKSASGTIESPGKNVAAKSGLNKSILRIGWFEIERQLGYKTKWYGSQLVLADPKYTSCECSKCHHIAKENRKTQDWFSCVSCGHSENADINASKVILDRGHRLLACGETVAVAQLCETGTSENHGRKAMKSGIPVL